MKIIILFALVASTLASDCTIQFFFSRDEGSHKESGFVLDALGGEDVREFKFFDGQTCLIQRIDADWYNPTWNLHNALKNAGLRRRDLPIGSALEPTILIFVESYSDFGQLRDYVHDEKIVRTMKYTNTYVVMVGLRTRFHNLLMNEEKSCVIEQKESWEFKGWVHTEKCTTMSTKINPKVYGMDRFFIDHYPVDIIDPDEIIFDLTVFEHEQSYSNKLKIAIAKTIFHILYDMEKSFDKHDTIDHMCDKCS